LSSPALPPYKDTKNTRQSQAMWITFLGAILSQKVLQKTFYLT